jgi:hypothetical protein
MLVSVATIAIMFVTFETHDLAALAGGTLSFTDVTAIAGMASTVTGSHGAAWADVTGDGYPDLYLTYNECRTGPRRDRFYRNLGGSFVEEAGNRGLGPLSGGTHGGLFADLDNDGDYDLLLGETYREDCISDTPPPVPNRILRNNGGVFAEATPPGMAAYADYTRSMLAIDLEDDGDLDVFAVNGDQGSIEPIPDRNEVYRNDGGMTFASIESGPLVTTAAGQAAADTDYDGDGDMDILLPNYTGEMGVLRNDGGGTFTSVPPASIGLFHRATTGISAGDLNNDGWMDLVIIDQNRDGARPLGFDRVAFVYLNVGGGRFSFAGEIRNFGGYTAGLADLDNDGDLDLTLPGMPFVMLNDGHAGFTRGPAYPTPMASPTCSGQECLRPDPRTVAFADIDGDGDLDSVVTAKFGPFRLIRNDFNAGNWIKLKLTTSRGQAGAFGARVRVLRAGTTQLVAVREAKSAYGYLSQDDPVMHIGLGTATSVDVEVTFVDGTREVRQGVTANQTIAFGGGPASGARVSAPSGLTASVAGSLVTLTWDLPSTGSDGTTSYVIDVGNAPGVTNLGVFPAGAARSFTASAPPGTYFVRVRALNGAGASEESNEVVVSVPGGGAGCAIPAAPSGLSFTVQGALVTLTWRAPASGSPTISYLLEAGSSAGASNVAAIDLGGPALSASAQAPPGRYFVRVRGRVGCGTGPPSNEVVIDVH